MSLVKELDLCKYEDKALGFAYKFLCNISKGQYLAILYSTSLPPKIKATALGQEGHYFLLPTQINVCVFLLSFYCILVCTCELNNLQEW